MIPPPTEPNALWSRERRRAKIRKRFGLATYAVVAVWAALFIRAAIVVTHDPNQALQPTHSVRYLGVYEPDAPESYADINKFAQEIGRQPNLVSYYSHWNVPFQVRFATAAEQHGAVTLVQIAPRNISLASIASGHYDRYLNHYAQTVKAFGHPVVLSFCHEMNGDWYSWSFRSTPPAVFVAAWRHVVTLFRKAGATNVTWLWTINIIGDPNHAPPPKPWWPGSSYVNWVGIDGYYRNSTIGFASVFGPTIAKVRQLTPDPILIAETAAQPSDGQPAKIGDLFAGVRNFGLLGFVWFDRDDFSLSTPGKQQYWRLYNPRALAAFRRNASAFMETKTNPAQMDLRSSSP